MHARTHQPKPLGPRCRAALSEGHGHFPTCPPCPRRRPFRRHHGRTQRICRPPHGALFGSLGIFSCVSLRGCPPEAGPARRLAAGGPASRLAHSVALLLEAQPPRGGHGGPEASDSGNPRLSGFAVTVASILLWPKRGRCLVTDQVEATSAGVPK